MTRTRQAVEKNWVILVEDQTGQRLDSPDYYWMNHHWPVERPAAAEHAERTRACSCCL